MQHRYNDNNTQNKSIHSQYKDLKSQTIARNMFHMPQQSVGFSFW